MFWCWELNVGPRMRSTCSFTELCSSPASHFLDSVALILKWLIPASSRGHNSSRAQWERVATAEALCTPVRACSITIVSYWALNQFLWPSEFIGQD
jgi:hypothetical protein